MSSSMKWSLCHYEMFLFIPHNIPVLKPTMLYINMVRYVYIHRYHSVTVAHGTQYSKMCTGLQPGSDRLYHIV